jgi:hypothetical protein
MTLVRDIRRRSKYAGVRHFSLEDLLFLLQDLNKRLP